MKIGIVGLPNVGKSSLFNALLKESVAHAENFPFCTIEPNVGIVPVQDERLEKISKLSQSKKTVPATVQFVDIAGLIAGAGRGEGLGNAFLGHIREVQAILQVVRIFPDAGITHVEGGVDPERDFKIILEELLFADAQQLEKQIGNREKKIKSGDPEVKARVAFLKKVQEKVLAGERIFEKIPEFSDEEKKWLKEIQLLTAKPMMVLLNVGLDELADAAAIVEKYEKIFGVACFALNVSLEVELIGADGAERAELLQDFVGEGEIPHLEDLIAMSYKTVGLQSYFTAGPEESRAWTVKVGATAPQAAGVIHTDFEKGFIKADVVAREKLVEAGSWAAARDRGWVRLEGKEYFVQDGDVMFFKFSK